MSVRGRRFDNDWRQVCGVDLGAGRALEHADADPDIDTRQFDTHTTVGERGRA